MRCAQLEIIISTEVLPTKSLSLRQRGTFLLYVGSFSPCRAKKNKRGRKIRGLCISPVSRFSLCERKTRYKRKKVPLIKRNRQCHSYYANTPSSSTPMNWPLWRDRMPGSARQP